MNNNIFIYIVLGHRSFSTGKICIIEMSEHYSYIDQYKEPAKKIACKKLGLLMNKDDISILDFAYLGENVSIFKA